MDDLSATVETYDRVAEEYRERHADRDVVRDLVERFLEVLTDPADGAPVVLDAGCGPGWETATLSAADCEVLGVDLTPAFLAAARTEAPGAHLARMDMRRPAVRDGALDGVWACGSLLHVPREEVGPTLAAWHRALRPGGAVVASLKRGDGTGTADTYDGDDRTFVYWRADDLRTRFLGAGFSDVAVTDGEWLQVVAEA